MKKPPVRMCIACREHISKFQLVRIVKDQTGALFIDKTGKKNGRGAYLCHNPGCLEKAYKKKGLERAFKMAVPEAVYTTLKEELAGHE